MLIKQKTSSEYKKKETTVSSARVRFEASPKHSIIDIKVTDQSVFSKTKQRNS